MTQEAAFDNGSQRVDRWPRLRLVARFIIAFAMMGVGIDHFLNPTPFIRIVPAFLPAPALLVYLSGVCEFGLGAAMLVRKLRPYAGLGLVALYLAVFPANINMAVHQIQLDPASPIPVWAMWARLPFQALFIAWALFARRDVSSEAQANPLLSRQ